VPGSAMRAMVRDAPLGGDFVLDQAKDAVPWDVARFDPATAVRFRVAQRWTPWVHAGNLEVSDEGFVFGDAGGLKFADVEQVEVSNFNASLTAITVIVVAAAVTGVALGGGGGGLSGCGNGLGSEDTTAPPTVPPDSPALAGEYPGGRPSLEGRRSLFSESEQRRSSVRLLGWVDLTSDTGAVRWTSLTPFFGARLSEVFEVGAGFSLYWAEPLRTLPVQNTPLGVPVSPQIPTVMPTVRMVLNFEMDPYRRVSLPLGLDVAMGLDGGVQVRVRWGLRARLGHVRVGLLPFTPTYSDGLGTLTPPWTFPTTLEVAAEW